MSEAMSLDARFRQIADGARDHGVKPYHVSVLCQMEQALGFRGRDILEVGGHLPKSFVKNVLGVRSWVAIEEPTFWKVSGYDHGATDATEGFQNFSLEKQDDYAVVLDGVENLPARLNLSFDGIYSVAAFHHIISFGPAIDAMYAALRSKGKLMAFAAPVWSSSEGHMLRNVVDGIGRDLVRGSGIIPPWGHLIWSKSEFYNEMRKRTDRKTAGVMTFEVYESNRVNRLMPNEYLSFIEMTGFGRHPELNHISASRSEMPDFIRERIALNYPRATHLEVESMSFLLAKE